MIEGRVREGQGDKETKDYFYQFFRYQNSSEYPLSLVIFPRFLSFLRIFIHSYIHSYFSDAVSLSLIYAQPIVFSPPLFFTYGFH